MRLRPIIFVLIATAAACGGGSLDNGGTGGRSATGTGGVGGIAGTTGVGGIAGTTGVGGTFVVGDAGAEWSGTGGSTGGAIAGSGGWIAGSGGAIGGSSGTGTGGVGSLPACGGSGGGSADVVELALVGPDGMAVTSTVSASVRVTAADACSTVTCPSIVEGSGQSFAVSLSGAATRFVLTAADARTWTLYLRNSAMPGDYLKVNDTFDMTVQAVVNQTFYASLNQTIVLAHGTDLALFASALSGFGIPPLPALDAFGIALTDAGARCEMPPSFGCINRPHAVHVTVGTASADVSGGTTTIGWLSFTNGGVLERKDTGNCDSKGGTTVAGFRTP
jgi:hypothetical protein